MGGLAGQLRKQKEGLHSFRTNLHVGVFPHRVDFMEGPTSDTSLRCCSLCNKPPFCLYCSMVLQKTVSCPSTGVHPGHNSMKLL